MFTDTEAGRLKQKKTGKESEKQTSSMKNKEKKPRASITRKLCFSLWAFCLYKPFSFGKDSDFNSIYIVFF